MSERKLSQEVLAAVAHLHSVGYQLGPTGKWWPPSDRAVTVGDWQALQVTAEHINDGVPWPKDDGPLGNFGTLGDC